MRRVVYYLAVAAFLAPRWLLWGGFVIILSAIVGSEMTQGFIGLFSRLNGDELRVLAATLIGSALMLLVLSWALLITVILLSRTRHRPWLEAARLRAGKVSGLDLHGER